jgi:hypothetical protein
MHLVSGAAVVLLAAATVAPAGQIVEVGQPIAVGPSFTSYTWGWQAAVGVSPVDGSFVVARTQDTAGGSPWSVWVDRFDASGTLLGSTVANPTATSYASGPRVAYDEAGSFVVSWEASPAAGGAHVVWMRRFDATGAAIGGETPVTTAGGPWLQSGRIGMAADGLLAAAWIDTSPGTAWLQYFRGGAPQLPADVNVAGGIDNSAAVLTAAIDWQGSSSAVGWITNQGPSSALGPPCSFQWGWDAMAQRVGADGQPIGGPLPVNEPRVGGLKRTLSYDIVPAGAGAFAAVWLQSACGATTGDLLGRIIKADGSLGQPFPVATSSSGGSVGSTPGGRTLVAVYRTPIGTFARAFDSAGSPVTDPAGVVNGGAVAAGRSSFVIAWVQSAPLVPDPYGGGGVFQVFAQRYALDQVRRVRIDIRPGAYPNTINLGSNGVVKVAILSESDFDATSVDPLSVTLADAGVRLRGNGTPMTESHDVNGDDLIDLVVAVSTNALALASTDQTATLTGRTADGLKIEGEDTVRLLK